MLILRDHDMVEQRDQMIADWQNSITIGNLQCAAGAEVILYVDDE